MDSAIPTHLQCPRTRARKIADDYVPPYPSLVARFAPLTKQVVMAYFGLQVHGDTFGSDAKTKLTDIAVAFGKLGGPRHWDRAQYLDEAGYTNVISIGYWDAPADFDAWFHSYAATWTAGKATKPGFGSFTEVVRPTVERFETLFSSPVPEGVAVLARGFSDTVQEHAYWGGARDRMPLSQTDALEPSGTPQVIDDGLLRTVVPHDNLCLIRSGQDWSATEAEERRMYLNDVEPVLRAGMDFLRDDGLQVGCFANRYMTVIDDAGRPAQKTFGLSWWRSLEALERWAQSHPTHVAIFGAAMKYLGELGPAAKLRLYHEVTVATANEQQFKYFNCHPRTGMLRSATLAATSGR
jgi:aldoxime dehydratase